MKKARRSKVIGTASRAPSAPSRRVQTMRERKVISALRPTVAPTKRGWMKVWIVTFRTQ